ncbi:MAG TPA: molybdenum cofactor biosynthesis protein MoaE [Acidimicrobiales bacterium]
MRAPESGQDWLALTSEELPIDAAYSWAVRPDCGAVVIFSGTVRDHAEGRTGVTALAYEAYEEHVLPRLERIAAEIRRRWPDVGRVVMWHRVGTLALGESSVVVVVSSPHRPAAFEAARFGIDALKATAPIWKKESWGGDDAGADGGDPRQDWALAAQDVADLAPPTPER